jgi:hypothetical protein
MTDEHAADLADDDTDEPDPHALPWRTGRCTGRTIFDADDRLIGVLDRPELAARAVDAVNGAQRATDADDLLDRVLGNAEAYAALPPGLRADIRKHLGA